MKTKLLRGILVIIVAVSFLPRVPTAQALPRYGSDICYYDGNWNLIGERYTDCSGNSYMTGTRVGVVYEYADEWDCTGGTPGYNGCCYTDTSGNCLGTVNCNYF